MGTLMPIMPTFTPRWKRRAASPLEVKMAVPLPYGLALTSSMASSTERAVQHRQHRPEDLLAVGVHLGGDVVEHRRADEEAALVAGHDQPAPVDGDPRALLLARPDQRRRCGRAPRR